MTVSRIFFFSFSARLEHFGSVIPITIVHPMLIMVTFHLYSISNLNLINLNKKHLLHIMIARYM